MEKINWALLLSASLAAAGTVASATKSALKADAAYEMSARDHDALMNTSSKANAAFDLVSKDHDTVVRLEVLLPKLERAVDRLESAGRNK